MAMAKVLVAAVSALAQASGGVEVLEVLEVSGWVQALEEDRCN
jgi:hypothetical protein